MPEEAAISGLDDASQARVRLLQSGRAVHAPILGIGLQPFDADLTTIAGLTPAAGAVMIGDGANWTADTTPTLTGLLTVNGQIKFPAAQNASADANTLDDYEEGTWTPAFTPTGSPFTSITYSAQVGHYEKIGRQVRIFGNITVSAVTIGAASGNLTITGLPFSGVFGAPATIGFITAFTTNTPIHGAVNTTFITLYHRTAITGGAVNSTPAVVSSASDIYFGATYHV